MVDIFYEDTEEREKRSEWISNYYIYKIASERKYQAMKQTFDNELIPFLYSPKQGFITYFKTYCSSINSIIQVKHMENLFFFVRKTVRDLRESYMMIW